MKDKWIDVKLATPKLDEEILVWVGDDQQCFDVATYNPTWAFHNNGFQCNLTPNNYRNITHWKYIRNKPKNK